MRSEWVEPALKVYRRDETIRRLMDWSARKNNLDLKILYERIVWPFQESELEFADILRGRVRFVPPLGDINNGSEEEWAGKLDSEMAELLRGILPDLQIRATQKKS